MTSKMNNNILWTATDFTLPETLWKRLEGMGYKVLLSDKNTDLQEKIRHFSPRLWVEQVNGDSESCLCRLQGIKNNFPLLSVILMSNQPSVEDAVTAIKMGVFDYIKGSTPADRLWPVIEGALNFTPLTGIAATQRPKTENSGKELIAKQQSMIKIMALARRIAPSRSTVLINGETGVGKEVIARFIHNNSPRKDNPFIAVNCAALPESLLESELFGHEKGAFTGAVTRKKGKFELANNGTILLDEISEMEVSIQAKLLRVLQEREIDRVGGQFVIPVDTRVIATTNRDLEEETKNGNFRTDLFYRLNVVPIRLPPLRERPDDIAPLAQFLLKKHCSLNDIPLKRISQDAEDLLKNRSWPGNVREFENLIERATLLVDSEDITSEDIERICNPEQPGGTQIPEFSPVIPLKEMEKKMIFKALDNHDWNRTHAAKMLGISVRTLRNKLHEYEDELPGMEAAAGAATVDASASAANE